MLGESKYITAQRILQKYFDALNKKYYENKLPTVILTIQKKGRKNVLGHFTPAQVWESGEEKKHEINLSAEAMKREFIEVITTLHHEMVHLYCHTNEIKDTSRSGTYHNKTFKAEAESKDLQIEYSKSIGWSITKASNEFKEFINSIRTNLDIFDICRRDFTNNEQVKKKKKQKYYKYSCLDCGGTVRGNKELKITCCDKQMVIEKK